MKVTAMPASDPALYVPLSDKTLHGIVDSTKSLAHTLDRLSIAELASLCLLAGLPKLKKKPSRSAESVLAEIIDTFNSKARGNDLSGVRRICKDQLDRDQVETGYKLLPEFNISLLDPDSCEKRDYLTQQGRWNYHFKERHDNELARQQFAVASADRTIILSAEQSRLFREFRADTDDHMHVQGYAGTGKTLMIRSLLSLFESSNARLLVLAELASQLEVLGIDRRRSGKVRACTFSELAALVIPENMSSAATRNMLRQKQIKATQSDEALIRRLGLRTADTQNVDQLIFAIRSTVFSFCHSKDSHISEKHIPAHYATRLDATLQASVCQYAKQLWQLILSPPTADFKPQVRGFHKIKWAALNRWAIPEHYSHVLVDECHDLPAPVHQILTNSPQARITLGDDYQNLKGRSSSLSSSTRHREMVRSVRSGNQLEAIINPIISAHPSRIKTPFEGNNSSQLDICYYSKARIPDEPALILVGNTWGLFEWSQRLANAAINVKLMSEPRDLDMFVQDCIELRSGVRGARHRELFRYRCWDDVANKHAGSSGFERVSQLLAKGYGHQDWQRTYRQFRQATTPRYSLGLIESVRNLEFDTVMLAPDIVNQSSERRHAAFSCTIYVAVSRARRRLIVPETLRHWVEDLSLRASEKS